MTNIIPLPSPQDRSDAAEIFIETAQRIRQMDTPTTGEFLKAIYYGMESMPDNTNKLYLAYRLTERRIISQQSFVADINSSSNDPTELLRLLADDCFEICNTYKSGKINFNGIDLRTLVPMFYPVVESILDKINQFEGMFEETEAQRRTFDRLARILPRKTSKVKQAAKGTYRAFRSVVAKHPEEIPEEKNTTNQLKAFFIEDYLGTVRQIFRNAGSDSEIVNNNRDIFYTGSRSNNEIASALVRRYIKLIDTTQFNVLLANYAKAQNNGIPTDIAATLAFAYYLQNAGIIQARLPEEFYPVLAKFSK